MRYRGPAYRAHDPRWSFAPVSGEGAAIHGGRFNPKGMPALYLALSPMTAIKEANQGFARKMDPLVLCEYEIDCVDIRDLRDPKTLADATVTADDLACGWLGLAALGRTPPTWDMATRLIADGAAGVLAPSFAPGALESDVNLILWRWGDSPPHLCRVHDPAGRLPKDQLSWT